MTGRMRACLAVACLLAATACFRDSPTEPGPIDRQVTLAPGQSANIEGAGILLRFVGVTSDNRCPADVICIVAGSATVQVRVVAQAGSRDITFETGAPKPATHDGLTLELVQLQPYPLSTSPIRDDDYRATLRVTR